MALKEVKVKPDGKLFLNLNSLRENVYNLSKEYRCIQLIHNGVMDVVSELLFVVHGSTVNQISIRNAASQVIKAPITF